jgi:hypothetical protein
MQLITHIKDFDNILPPLLKDHITARYRDLVETEDDIPPIFIIVEEDDDISGPDFAAADPRISLDHPFQT